ncbi:MAG: hypothetical protein K2I79_04125, partial [Clostridia bacterium]|nr:hypothetical protein [Clostridia bacterium]
MNAPTDFSTTYTGSTINIDSAIWYDRDIHGDSSKMSVTYSDATHTNVNEYTVTLTIKDSYITWADATSPTDLTRTCKMIIKEAEPIVNPIIGTGQLYPGSNMPSITLSPGDTSGSIAWDDSKIAEGKTTYNWTFTSSDSNYKDKTGSATLTISSIEVNAIQASFTLPVGTTIYASTSLDSLKNYLTVTKKNNNGTTAGTAGQSEYSLSGSLNAGQSTITVTLNGTTITTTFTVDVTAVALTSMTASLKSGSTIFTTTPLDDIKALLTVTGTNND